MSGETNKSWVTTASVIGICAAIGFAAVYAMVDGPDNNRGGNTAQEIAASEPALASGGLRNEAQPRSAAPATSDERAAPQAASAPLLGSDGKQLNRGAMTTFVFKKQPTAVVKQPTFNGPDGQSMTLDDLKGKVVLLNLWATWCAPCRKEMPYLDTLQKELGSDQFEVVALSVDRGSPQKAKDFLAEVGASSLKFYHDPTAQAGFALMAIGMPTTLLFDREGREIGRLAGPAEWHSKEAKDLIRAAIAAG